MSDVVIVSADGPVPLERRGDSWVAPQCAAHGCRIRYGFALRRAAEGRDDEDLAALYGDMIVSPPGAWLLRPLRVTQDSTAELKVSAAEGVRFAAGLPPGVLSASSLGGLPYAAFGDLRVEPIRLQGVSLTVAIARARRRQSEEELLDWIRASAAMIADYFGRFPADGALLLVAPAPDKQIHGRARGTGGASILFSLGTELESARQEMRERRWAAARVPASLVGASSTARLNCRLISAAAAACPRCPRPSASRARCP